LAAALLATSSPNELRRAADEAVGLAEEFADQIRARKMDGLARLDAFDEAMSALSDAGDRFDLIAVTHPDDAMRDAADEGKQVVAAFAADLSLDPVLYQAMTEIDPTGFDRATGHYLERLLLDFTRAGVDRDDVTRARIRELRDELVGIDQSFDRNIRTHSPTARFNPAQLAGLPEDFVRAHPAGPDGLVEVGIEYPDLIPFLQYASDASAREELWRLARQRGYPANVEVLDQMLTTRHALAGLLGAASWADHITGDKMIESSANIADFIERVAEVAAGRAERDYALLLTRKRRDEPDADAVQRWDTAYLEDRLKAENLSLHTQDLRPYFEYSRVAAGLLALAERLFGVTFRRNLDVPVWHPEVTCHDVFDGDILLGRFFLDMHPRPNKFNHAACFGLTRGKAGQRIPECVLVCNLPRAGAEPALLQYTEVRTFFHEFGHLLHAILGGQGRWSGTNGIATEWDFVEAPSQMLEEWVQDPATLATFAKHHETGEVLPADLVDRLRASLELNKGLFVRVQLQLAWISYDLYSKDPAGRDIGEIDRAALTRFTPFHPVPDTHFVMAFGHLSGYTALYYTYMWSQVIAKDLFTEFAREGLLDEQTAARYRSSVLEPGGSAPAAQLVTDFLGRPYAFDAFQEWLDAG
jgi:thimet oligopeptidase